MPLARKPKTKRVAPKPIQTSKFSYNVNTKTYEVDGVLLHGVTDWIKQYIKPFDALNKAKGINFSNKNKGIENQFTPLQQTKYWNLNNRRKQELGKAAHTFAELYEMNPSIYPVLGMEYALIDFIENAKQDYISIGNELKVYSKEYGLIGIIDKLYQHKETGKYVIVDWKSWYDTSQTYGKMLGEFSSIPQGKYYEYSIQQLVYVKLGTVELPNNTKIQLTFDNVLKCSLILLKEDRTWQAVNCDMSLLPVIDKAMDSLIDYDKIK